MFICGLSTVVTRTYNICFFFGQMSKSMKVSLFVMVQSYVDSLLSTWLLLFCYWMYFILLG